MAEQKHPPGVREMERVYGGPQREIDDLCRQLDAMTAERDELRAENAKLRGEFAEMTADRNRYRIHYEAYLEPVAAKIRPTLGAVQEKSDV